MSNERPSLRLRFIKVSLMFTNDFEYCWNTDIPHPAKCHFKGSRHIFEFKLGVTWVNDATKGYMQISGIMLFLLYTHFIQQFVDV